MARTGRPKIQIDPKQFEKLCSIWCTEEEIAGFFNCSVDTIERFCKRTYKMTFADAYKNFSAEGKIALRRNQLRLSEKNAAMAIFLGKNYLDQKDAPIQIDTKSLDKAREILDGIDSVIGKEPEEQPDGDYSETK